jgi:hypothetical protein
MGHFYPVHELRVTRQTPAIQERSWMPKSVDHHAAIVTVLVRNACDRGARRMID